MVSAKRILQPGDENTHRDSFVCRREIIFDCSRHFPAFEQEAGPALTPAAFDSTGAAVPEKKNWHARQDQRKPDAGGRRREPGKVRDQQHTDR